MNPFRLPRSVAPIVFNLLLLVALLAPGVLTVNQAQPEREPVTVRLAECLDGPLRTAHQPTSALLPLRRRTMEAAAVDSTTRWG